MYAKTLNTDSSYRRYHSEIFVSKDTKQQVSASGSCLGTMGYMNYMTKIWFM